MRGNALFKRIDRWLGVPLLWLLGLPSRLGWGARPGKPLAPGSRVLAIKFAAMGDCLLLLPTLKAARQQIGPEGRLEIVVTPLTAMVVRGLDWIDAVHVVDPKGLLARPWELGALLWRLRRQGFDWALDFDQWLRISALIAALSGAAQSAGFKTPGQSKHLAFDRCTPNVKDRHEFEQFIEVAALAGLEAGRVEPYAGFLSRSGWRGAARSPQAGPKLAVLHPGCGAHGWRREWPLERYAALCKSLRAEGYAVAYSGAGAHERELIDQLEALAGPPDEQAFEGGIEALVRLLGRASLLLSGNTGVMHLGAGIGTPLLGLHGPNPRLKWGPLGPQSRSLEASLPCSPCLNLGFEYGCPERPCMESIPLGAVLATAMQIMKDPA